VESLRRLPPPAGDDPRIDLFASDAWRSLGNFMQGQAFAAQAAQKARTQNAKLLLARGLYLQGSTLKNLGDANGAMAAVAESGQILRRDGWRCQSCGTISNLEVHHRQFRSQSGADTEGNLITLCVDCHRQAHGL